MKRNRLLSLIALALALLAAGPGFSEEEKARPNIVFIFTDDHASHAISAYGSKINQTPNIDRLAREGMLFRNCFCTNSICAPSRAVILTGKHSHVNGLIDNAVTFDGGQQTFPKLLQKAGYQTAMIGKWHLKSDPTGFDFWQVLPGQGIYYNPDFLTPEGRKKVTGYTTDVITDVTLDWLKNRRDKDKPFLLMTQHKAPHREWAPGPKHLTMYDDVTIPEPATLFDDYAGRTSAAKKQTMSVEKDLNARDLKLTPPPYLNKEQREKWDAAYGPKNEAFKKADPKGRELVRWKYQRYIKDYLRCVAGVDDNVGRLLDYLDESGLSKNTVVIYSSDQGFYLGDHGWFDKRWMYEESLRMPLLVRWPGVVKAGSENGALVQNLDFAETFLDMAGVKVPEDMQGRSLVPLLKGETPAGWRDAIYYHYYEYYGPGTVHDVQRHYGVRTQRHKLIHYYLIDEWELFDLAKDPDELRSVYADPAYQDVVRDLKARLKELREKYKVEDFKEPPLRPRRGGGRARPGLALHLDFSKVGKGRVTDVSGRKHHAQHTGGEFVKGRAGSALELAGEGGVAVQPAPAGLSPAEAELTVGAWCRPAAGDGVIVAHGGESLGYSLFLRDGQPHFAVRSQGNLFTARAEAKTTPGEWVHLAGHLGPDGRVSVVVNGRPSGEAVKGELIAGRPADGLSVGADTGSRVGDHEGPLPYRGLIEDVRVYLGKVEEAALREWASGG